MLGTESGEAGFPAKKSFGQANGLNGREGRLLLYAQSVIMLAIGAGLGVAGSRLFSRKSAEGEQNRESEEKLKAPESPADGRPVAAFSHEQARRLRHDFNNLITPILGYADLALRQLPADDQWHGIFLEIRRSAERAQSFISELLKSSGPPPAMPAEVVSSANPAAAAYAGNTAEVTVLVVDDDPNIRTFVAKILHDRGFIPVVTDSAENALHLVCNGHKTIDLLLTDIFLPGMNGRELHEALSSFRPGLKVLYMSGYSYKQIAAHGLLRPNMRILSKPFKPEDLLGQVFLALNS